MVRTGFAAPSGAEAEIDLDSGFGSFVKLFARGILVIVNASFSRTHAALKPRTPYCRARSHNKCVANMRLWELPGTRLGEALAAARLDDIQFSVDWGVLLLLRLGEGSTYQRV